MKKRFLSVLVLLLASLQLAVAQSARRATAGWYTVQNHVLGLRSGSSFKPLRDALTLPNGNRLDPLTDYVVLPTGEHAPLGPDDVVLASGEIVRVGSHSADSPAGAAPAVAAASPSAFSYVPAAPVGGQLKGMVELGASGFNSFIVRIDPQRRWKLEKAEYGNSLVMENMASDDDIRRGLKAYIGRMLDYGVDGHNIYFIVSSGAASSAGTPHIIAALKALGYVVHVVTHEQEGSLGLRATVPAALADQAFLVDIGSANTKIGWLDHGTASVVNTYGSKYFQQQLTDSAVATDVRAKASQVPAAHRQTCFIIGGVPYEMAKALRQGQESYTVLKPAAEYTHPDGAKAKAGQVIYNALTEATGCKQFVFVWDANFTIGYLLAKQQ